MENLTLLNGTGTIATGNTLNNIITGNSGNNSLSGGDGNDTLTGGTGLDSFRFNSTSERLDLITDFNVTDDTIQVSRSGFGGSLAVGTLLSTQFELGTSATTSAHRFIYNSSNGGLFFDVDGSGATTAVQIATLNTGLALTNADIVII
ncbi:M10 family metallopeptidase C-terminal domain-containing protein [Geminocystis sp. NIES-3709]|uniref:M10 family metallopeptidase C-terminal domain-containing protein n=1 Tax=Geminocystis sp. NIES-3709 TaxID=1617448 RepID=UPI0005FC5B80|nr:M10 family metallopeptidase C-terminal domain-containing protein [Geminocystis sp. NIES-3709]BAQ65932.1 alkaline phosphatase [Geminocystis sp. NIES-3709]